MQRCRTGSARTIMWIRNSKLWVLVSSGRLRSGGKTRIGGSLRRIAHKTYGDVELWPDIYEATRDRILDEDKIFPGLSVRIPRRLSSLRKPGTSLILQK